MSDWQNVAEVGNTQVPVEQLRQNVIDVLRTVFDPEIPGQHL